MLVEVKTVDEGVVRRLTDIYAESMDALEKHFPSREQMLAEYAAFAADFARQKNQRILAEDAGNGWGSALRAIEAQPGSWFLEAVETMPSQRGKGHGKALVLDTLRYLEGLVDIYLPDLKYLEADLAGKYSHAKDYPEVAMKALEEMVRQVRTPEFDERGMMKKGVIVRHLLLPGHVRNSKKVLEYLYGTYGDQIYISLMNQYTPMPAMKDDPQLSRKVTDREYDRLLDHAISFGVTNCFIQEGETAKESFIPEFNGEGI